MHGLPEEQLKKGNKLLKGNIMVIWNSGNTMGH